MGTAAIKIVELAKEKKGLPRGVKAGLALKNYGLTEPKETNDFRTTDLSDQQLGGLIRKVISEMKPKTKKAVISLPVASSFSTLVELPAMPESELVAAIPFEAKKFIPIPLNEVELDWSVVERKAQPRTGPTLILLVAVPKEVIKKYAQVARIAGLNLLALEQEAFSLARSLIGSKPGVFLIADIGNKSTDLVVVEDGFVRVTHNLETTAKEMAVKEIARVVNLYQERYNKKIEHCFLAGGTILAGDSRKLSETLAKDWLEILKERLGLEVKIGQSLAGLIYPPALKEKMAELEPALAVAIGLAMRELLI